MAHNFRPVKTIWGEASSCFMPSDAVERALLGLADLAGCETTTEDRDGFYTEVWISDGKAFFAYLKAETQRSAGTGRHGAKPGPVEPARSRRGPGT